MTPEFPAKQPIVGTPISVTTFAEVREKLRTPIRNRATVVAVCNVHSVMSARSDPELAQALGSADIATPDGMPLVWGLRALGHHQPERVYGPGLMRYVIADDDAEHSHFLFGSTPETLTELQTAISRLNPSIRIAGAVAPPFRPLTSSEDRDVTRKIEASGADVVWVGLGMPKQELWMHRVRERLPGTTLIGVGAAFDFLAGVKTQAPHWMQDSGLEWLFRLMQEPRRLWRRYLWHNPAYLGLLAQQLFRHRFQGSTAGR